MFILLFLLILFFAFYLQKHPGSLLEGFYQTQVSTLAVKDNLLVAGGFQGEIICKVIPSYLLSSPSFVKHKYNFAYDFLINEIQYFSYYK